jgi:hypothetical protein
MTQEYMNPNPDWHWSTDPSKYVQGIGQLDDTSTGVILGLAIAGALLLGYNYWKTGSLW